VKPEQAPKDLTWRSSCPHNGEDHWRMALENRSGRTNPPGYWAQHAQKHQNATREICRGALVRRNDSFRGRPTQKSEELIVVLKPGNAGGAKGLWFGVRSNEMNERGSA
jgi:hypothetical protein